LSAYPVTLHDHQNGWILDSYNSFCPTLPSANPTSFEAFCSLLEDWESQLLFDVHLSFDPFILISKLETSLFRACSDGSAVTQEGTYGWALSLEDGTRLAHGAVAVILHNLLIGFGDEGEVGNDEVSDMDEDNELNRALPNGVGNAGGLRREQLKNFIMENYHV
jgi:hypothetical protein